MLLLRGGVASRQVSNGTTNRGRSTRTHANIIAKLSELARPKPEDSGMVKGNSRDDYDDLELEQYFNYMGILAIEGNYDSMNAFKQTGLHPMEIMLLLASREGDVNRVQEILNVGPDLEARDPEGRSVSDLAGMNKPEKREEILEMIQKHHNGETV